MKTTTEVKSRRNSKEIRETILKGIPENIPGIGFNGLLSKLGNVSTSVLASHLKKLINEGKIRKTSFGTYVKSEVSLIQDILNRSVEEIRNYLEKKSTVNRVTMALNDIVGSPGNPAEPEYRGMVNNDQILVLLKVLKSFIDGKRTQLKSKFVGSLSVFLKEAIFQKYGNGSKVPLLLREILVDLEKTTFQNFLATINSKNDFVSRSRSEERQIYLDIYKMITVNESIRTGKGENKYEGPWTIFKRFIDQGLSKLEPSRYDSLYQFFVNDLLPEDRGWIIEVLKTHVGELYELEMKYADSSPEKASFFQELRKHILDRAQKNTSGKIVITY